MNFDSRESSVIASAIDALSPHAVLVFLQTISESRRPGVSFASALRQTLDQLRSVSAYLGFKHHELEALDVIIEACTSGGFSTVLINALAMSEVRS